MNTPTKITANGARRGHWGPLYPQLSGPCNRPGPRVSRVFTRRLTPNLKRVQALTSLQFTILKPGIRHEFIACVVFLFLEIIWLDNAHFIFLIKLIPKYRVRAQKAKGKRVRVGRWEDWITSISWESKSWVSSTMSSGGRDGSTGDGHSRSPNNSGRESLTGWSTACGVKQGISRSTWTVCRVFFCTCLILTTTGLWKLSIFHGPSIICAVS